MTVLAALVAAAVVTTAAVPAAARAATKDTSVLAQGAGMGSRPSAAVRGVQRVLRSRGYSLGRPGVDGRFGPLTAAAVRRLQADSGLAADGIVGPKTRTVVRRIERRSQRASSTRRTSTRTRPPTPKPRRHDATGRAYGAAGGRQGSRAPTSDGSWSSASSPASRRSAWPRSRRSQRRSGRRPGEAGAIAPLAHDLYLEGRSTDEAVADFRGQAFAATVAGQPGDDPSQGQTWYLVDDVRKPAPVWVREDDVRRSPSGLAPGEPVIGYVTVSSEGQRSDADGSVREIEEACERAAWELAEVVTDRESGRGLERPGLAYALKQIAEGKARGLVVSDLRRLSRSIVDLGALMEWFRDARAGLVALDLGVDTSTPAGHEVAATLITLGDWERERIAKRTRSGLAEVRASGRPDRPSDGQRPPRPGRAHHRDARRQHDAAGDRRPAQRRGCADPEGRGHVEAVERAGGPGLPAPRHPQPARSVPHSGRQGVGERAKPLRNGARM